MKGIVLKGFNAVTIFCLSNCSCRSIAIDINTCTIKSEMLNAFEYTSQKSEYKPSRRF